DDEPAEQRERQPPEQRRNTRREPVLRLRDQERADERLILALAEVDRLRDREPRLLRAWKTQREVQDTTGPDRGEVDHVAAQLARVRPGPRKQIDPGGAWDEVDGVAGRSFELRRRHGIVRAARLLDVEPRDAGGLATEIPLRAAQGVRAEELERDRS